MCHDSIATTDCEIILMLYWLSGAQVLQGKEDMVVPQNQAEMLVDKIKKTGGKVKYILFEGEGHGFRKSENVKRALEEELAWYENIFGLGNQQ